MHLITNCTSHHLSMEVYFHTSLHVPQLYLPQSYWEYFSTNAICHSYTYVAAVCVAVLAHWHSATSLVSSVIICHVLYSELV